MCSVGCELAHSASHTECWAPAAGPSGTDSKRGRRHRHWGSCVTAKCRRFQAQHGVRAEDAKHRLLSGPRSRSFMFRVFKNPSLVAYLRVSCFVWLREIQFDVFERSRMIWGSHSMSAALMESSLRSRGFVCFFGPSSCFSHVRGYFDLLVLVPRDSVLFFYLSSGVFSCTSATRMFACGSVLFFVSRVCIQFLLLVYASIVPAQLLLLSLRSGTAFLVCALGCSGRRM